MEEYIGLPIEHSESFMTLSKIIKTEAAAALIAFQNLSENGWTEKDILEDWNGVFDGIDERKFKSYEELIDYLENVGI